MDSRCTYCKLCLIGIYIKGAIRFGDGDGDEGDGDEGDGVLGQYKSRVLNT